MTKVYDQFDRAFANVSAWAILHDGKPVGRIAFKHGGAVTCYLHLTGSQMSRGQAGGGGYDRASAAAGVAISKLDATIADTDRAELIRDLQLQFAAARSGERWETIFSNAGFELASVL